MKIILQKEPSSESRSITSYAAIHDGVEVVRTHYSDLPDFRDILKSGAMPVGSVEFVQHAFKLMGIDQPGFNPYDDCLDWSRKINVSKIMDIRADVVTGGLFVKPVNLKQFNGFVYKGDLAQDHDEHDFEQLETLKLLPLDTPIYTSDVVKFDAEWRCYITNGKLIKACRYDSNDEEYDLDDNFVNNVISCLEGRTLAADIGLTSEGCFSVVELNDAWAIGKYREISDTQYVQFLSSRWSQIINDDLQCSLAL